MFGAHYYVKKPAYVVFLSFYRLIKGIVCPSRYIRVNTLLKGIITMFSSYPLDAGVKKSEKILSSFNIFHKGTFAIILVTFVLSLALIWYGFVVKQKVVQVEQQWHDYSNEAILSSRVLSRIQKKFGYGGFIHDFKNYVLRKDASLIPKIEKSLAETRDAIKNYPLQGLFQDLDDEAYLKNLAYVVDQYSDKFELAKRLIAKGISSNEIDRQIKVNDNPAFQAIEHLSRHSVEHHDEYSLETSKRLNNALNFINWGLLLLPLVILSGIFMLVLLRKVRDVNNSLNENRKFLSDMFEAASDAILIVDKLGIITEANKQAIELFGLSANNLKGKNVESLMPKRFRDQHSSIRKGSFAEAKSRELNHALEFYALGKDEKEIPVEISLSYTTRNEEKYAMVSLRDITDRKESEKILHRNEIMLRRAQHVASIGSWDWDIKSNTLVWSDEIFNIFGEKPSLKEVSYDDFLAHIHPGDKEEVINAINSALIYDQSYNIEHRIVRPDGTQRLVYEQGDVFRDETGEAINMVGVVRDITEQKQNEIKLTLADNVFNSTSESIIVTDSDERILRVNSAFKIMTGYSNEEVIGKTPGQLLKSGKHDDAFYKSMWKELSEKDNWQGEIWDRRKDGSHFRARHNISAVKDEQGKVFQYISIFLDVTEQKRAVERIQYLAQYDQLTKLPNRALFNDRLQHSIDRAQRNKDKIGLMFIDLDGFKNVNDTLGHQAGDELLQVIAERLSNTMRIEDTVARIGGDEFTIILDELHHSDGAIVVTKKVLQAVGEVIILSGQEVTIGASIGISIYPDNGTDANSLVKNADTAMYQAKKQGKNRFKFYINDNN